MKDAVGLFANHNVQFIIGFEMKFGVLHLTNIFIVIYLLSGIPNLNLKKKPSICQYLNLRFKFSKLHVQLL